MENIFKEIGEHFAFGLFEEEENSFFRRYSKAIRRFLENKRMPEYNHEPLYPCGSFWDPMCVGYHYTSTIGINFEGLKNKSEKAFDIMRSLPMRQYFVPNEHAVGGNMYTHSFANFGRIIREGLDMYMQRIERSESEDIRYGLYDVVEGIRAFHKRSLEIIKEKGDEESDLYKALERVPFKPARTLYEALVAWNFIYYMDGCDNIGRLDADLIEFYNGEDLSDVIRCMFKNVDANDGWSGALGPDYNELTKQCLRACKGLRRPSIELRVTPDMPNEIWDLAIDSIKAGGGSPSLYNELGYQSSLAEHFPEIPKEDLKKVCGGGCTETMLVGISNVGSLDAGINLALIFERYMREKLAVAQSFEDFYREFIDKCSSEILSVLDAISLSQKSRAEYGPNPMRTLLIDDCIDKGKDFNDGGARYAWSVVNIAGLINVLDSLLVIKKIIFEDKAMDGSEMLKKLDEKERFLKYPDVPRHGHDCEESNTMAKKLSEDICKIFELKKPYSGGKFLPSSIQFTTYVGAGHSVGATPDGRQAGEPLCDSIGSIFGNDKKGLTAMLNSASSLCQREMLGTPVLNVKLDRGKALSSLKAIVNSYFQNGGMQMQITCVSKEDMLDAQKHPEKYPNLIVRIGGYSEYFSRLSPELQQTVIDRTFGQM